MIPCHFEEGNSKAIQPASPISDRAAKVRLTSLFGNDVRTFAVIVGLSLGIAVGCWSVIYLGAKAKYERVRRELASSAYTVVAFDEKANAFRSEVEAAWTCASDETNTPDSDVVRTAGLTPCVSNLVYVFNYQLPPYGWLSPARNRKAATFGFLKANFSPPSVDRQWHVSGDYHLAMLWYRTNAVYIYRDEANGMRATLFIKKKGVDGAANGSEPARSETNRTSSAAGSRR